MARRQPSRKPITARKRPAPTTSTTSSSSPTSTLSSTENQNRTENKPKKPIKRPATATLIARFHAANARNDKLEIEALGGIDAYQRASMEGAKRKVAPGGLSFSSSKWVITSLQRLGWFGFRRRNERVAPSVAQSGLKDCSEVGESANNITDGSADGSADGSVGVGVDTDLEQSKRRKVYVLDVGALDTFLGKNPRFECVAIDLHPQHADVRKCDFFDFVREHRRAASSPVTLADEALGGAATSLAAQTDPQPGDGSGASGRPFDCVVLSLVLNFVPDKSDRGRMLALSRYLLRQDGQGALLVVLPKACVLNSRFLNHELLTQMCEALGFILVEHKFSSGKLAFYVFLYDPAKALRRPLEFPRQQVSRGDDRNNFAILLDRSAWLE